jgi:HSP20 family protein
MLPTLLDENRVFAAPARTYAPAFDCYETGTSWELLVDVPGVAREDLKLTLETNELTVQGSRKAPEVPEGSAIHTHRWSGEFSRTFRLGDGLDTSKVEASYKDGVLRVTIAKAEAAKPREIAIQ